jgi:hypothetical protein
MRTEVRWKAVQRITQGRLARAMATLALRSESRRSKTFRQQREQDRAEVRVLPLVLAARGEGQHGHERRQPHNRVGGPDRSTAGTTSPVIKPIPPTPEVLSWVRSRDIAYAKARGKGAVA